MQPAAKRDGRELGLRLGPEKHALSTEGFDQSPCVGEQVYRLLAREIPAIVPQTNRHFVMSHLAHSKPVILGRDQVDAREARRLQHSWDYMLDSTAGVYD